MSHMRVARPLSLFRLGLSALAGALLLALPLQSRADHIDDELYKSAEKLVKLLQDKGFKNVGVIKFLVKRGKDQLNANVGPINLNLATRLENALILGMDPAKPLGVIRDATQVAATADPKMSVRTAAGRAGLFKHSYPLAWGKDKVTADVFLTGTLDLSPDMKTTKVEIGYFDKQGDKIHDLHSFTVATDRSILADSGQSFAVQKRSLKKARSLEELDEEAAKSAAEADKGKPIVDQIPGENPLKFEIRYNDAVQTVSGDPASAGEMSVPTPQKGQTVTFWLTNTTTERIGVVVKVNGESTQGQEMSEDAACWKWVLEPNKPYTLRGFYFREEGKVAPFKVLDDEESAARMAEWAGGRPRAGFIDVAVFRESDGPEELKVARNLRGLPPAQQKKKPLATAKEAHELVRSLAQAAKKSRGLIVAGDQKEDAKLQEEALKNATLIYNMQINYYKPTTAP